MAFKIAWSPESLSNLRSIFQYISNDSEYYAALFIQQIVNIVESIPDFPKSGRVVPEYGNENIREKIYKNYRIVYRIRRRTVEIVAITHGAKPLKDLL